MEKIPENSRKRAGLNVRIAALMLLYFHEHFHHKIESFGIRMTLARQEPAFLNYWTGAKQKALQGKSLNIEEALANAAMYRQIGEAKYKNLLGSLVIDAAKKFLTQDFYPTSPVGYSSAPNYLSNFAFRQGLFELQARLSENSNTPKQDISDWYAAPRMAQALFNVDDLLDHLWLVAPSQVPPLLPGVAPLRSRSTRDILRCLRNLGWQVLPKRGKGSHIMLDHPFNEGSITLKANCKDLTPGLIKSVENVVGSSLGEWC